MKLSKSSKWHKVTARGVLKAFGKSRGKAFARRRGKLAEQLTSGQVDPHEVILSLREGMSVGMLLLLSNYLRKAPSEWMFEFVGLYGFNVLLESLGPVERFGSNSLLSCMERLLTVEATQTVLKHRGVLENLVQRENGARVRKMVSLAIDRRGRLLRRHVLRLLAVIVAYGAEGKTVVISALAEEQHKRHESAKRRFDPIIQLMEVETDVHVRLPCIQLINSLVSTEPDLSRRIAVRSEMAALGLREVLELVDKELGAQMQGTSDV